MRAYVIYSDIEIIPGFSISFSTCYHKTIRPFIREKISRVLSERLKAVFQLRVFRSILSLRLTLELHGVSKNVPNTKSILNLIFEKLRIGTATNGLNRTSGVYLSQFCFHMFNFVSRGSSKCLIFKWLCEKTLDEKCAASKYGMFITA